MHSNRNSARSVFYKVSSSELLEADATQANKGGLISYRSDQWQGLA
jgi:hypothetical protein